MKEQTRNTSANSFQANYLEKKLRINDSKDDQKPWKQNGENARIT